MRADERRLRWCRIAGWIALLVLVLLFAAGSTTIGFNPTDDGFVLSQSQRLLRGETPHVDFVSRRPVGSPLLHAITFAIPTPLLVTSRWFVLIELVAATWAQISILRRSFLALRDSLWAVCIVILAFVVNIHTFPLMAWHTIDGILLMSVGAVVLLRGLDRSAMWAIAFGSIVMGVALLAKQNFTPVMIIAPTMAIVLGKEGQKRQATAASMAVALPVAAYVSFVALRGGRLGQLLESGQIPPLRRMIGADRLSLFVASAAAGLLVVRICSPGGRVGRWVRNRPGLIVLSFSQLLFVSRVLVALMGSHLGRTFSWSWTVTWLSLASLAVAMCVSEARLVLAPAFLIPIFGIMAALSWGYPIPSLVAGSMCVLIGMASFDVWRTAIRAEGSLACARISCASAATGVAVVIAGGALLLSYSLRSHNVYRDVVSQEKFVDLASVSHDLAGIHSNARLVKSLSQVKRCTDRFPSSRLAVVPDGAIIPRLLGKTNPLPVDWWIPLEVPESRRFVMDLVKESMASPSGHLVLFQTFPMSTVATIDVRRTTKDAVLFDYEDGFAERLFEVVPGDVVICGGFVGRYQAPNVG